MTSRATPAPAQHLAVATTGLRVPSPSIDATAVLVAADLPSRATRPGTSPLRVQQSRAATRILQAA